MLKIPSAGDEASTPTGRRLWEVTLGVFGVLVVVGIIFLLIGNRIYHIGFPTRFPPH